MTRGQLELEGPIEIPYSEWGPDEMLGSAAVDTDGRDLALLRERGVLAMIRGDESPRTIALRLGG